MVHRFRSGDTLDPRRYHEPTSQDIAAIFTNERAPSTRDISVYGRSDTSCGDTHDVSFLNDHTGPSTYPLLFPAGTKGWCPELQIAGAEDDFPSQSNKPGACDFHAQRLMVQDRCSRMPHAGGCLFQQYIVDAYRKIGAQRLGWVELSR